MTYSPLARAGPVPLIRVFTSSAVGCWPVGIVATGALPGVALIVGRPFPPLDTVVPDADESAVYDLSTSMMNTSVVLPLTPSWESPLVP